MILIRVTLLPPEESEKLKTKNGNRNTAAQRIFGALEALASALPAPWKGEYRDLMVSFGDLLKDPSKLTEIGDCDVLIAAQGTAEVLVRKKEEEGRARSPTIIFSHETIQIMQAVRAEELDKLRQQFSEHSIVLPIRHQGESLWEYITLGRASTADLIVDDPAISNVHAHFEPEFGDANYCVQDVGSSNGTFVNREPVQPHTPVPLKSGDCVRFGQSVFYYVVNSMVREIVSPDETDL